MADDSTHVHAWMFPANTEVLKVSLRLDLTDRVALVTGGSRGIGRAVVEFLAQAGADVMIGTARRKEDADALAASLGGMGRGSAVVTGDLAEPGTAARYVEACRKRFSRLDILVNNAGIWEETPIESLEAAHLRKILAVNLESAFSLCREAAPLLVESPAGRIVNVSSTASLLGEPLHSAYAASKGGLDALTRSLAVELGPRGVTVNSVAPGWTRTGRTEADLDADLGRKLIREIPLGKVATADDVAYAVVYLASDWAGHVNGVTLPVEGGYVVRR